jgi:hypothetical protein
MIQFVIENVKEIVLIPIIIVGSVSLVRVLSSQGNRAHDTLVTTFDAQKNLAVDLKNNNEIAVDAFLANKPSGTVMHDWLQNMAAITNAFESRLVDVIAVYMNPPTPPFNFIIILSLSIVISIGILLYDLHLYLNKLTLDNG